MNNKPIGVIDSGVGGFSSCLEIKKILPQESIISFGDLLYMPYGQKTQEFLTNRTSTLCSYLEKMGCKAIIIACNTASTVFLNYPQAFAHVKTPIFDVISSTIQALLKKNLESKPLFTVLATQATTNSKIYEQKLSEAFPDSTIKSIAATEWPSLVETVSLDSQEMARGIAKYLTEIENIPSNNILLACTHFYYLEDLLKKQLPLASFLNTSTPVVENLKNYLQKHNLLSNSTPQHTLLASKLGDIYVKMAKETFGEDSEVLIDEVNGL